MAGAARHDVEKGQHMVVLIDLVARKFAAQDFSEGVLGVIGSHGVSRSKALRSGWFIGLAKRSGLGELASGFGDIGALALEIVGYRVAQAGVGDVMRGIGGLRQVAARDLVLALRAGLDRLQAALNCKIDRLIVADLEMQERVVFD